MKALRHVLYLRFYCLHLFAVTLFSHWHFSKHGLICLVAYFLLLLFVKCSAGCGFCCCCWLVFVYLAVVIFAHLLLLLQHLICVTLEFLYSDGKKSLPSKSVIESFCGTVCLFCSPPVPVCCLQNGPCTHTIFMYNSMWIIILLSSILWPVTIKTLLVR